VTKEGWLSIPRQQVDEKSMRTLSDGGSNDWPLKRQLFKTTMSLDSKWNIYDEYINNWWICILIKL
jgi:hypothetical protein